MSTTSRPAVVAVFHERGQADEAVKELVRLGFPEADIGVAARETFTEPVGSQWDVGAATGAAAGGATGTLLGIAVAAGLIPGVGSAVAGGLLGGIFASVAAGAAAGGVLGALVGLGVPEEEATFYRDEFRAGRVLVTVRAGDRASEAVAALRRHGAYDVTSRDQAAAPRRSTLDDVPFGLS
jgi:hypothetical protein